MTKKMSKHSYINRVAAIVSILAIILIFVSCGFETYTPDRGKIISECIDNRQKLIKCAEEVLAYKSDVYISSTDKYPIEDKTINGLYRADVVDGKNKNISAIDSENVRTVLETCGVVSIAANSGKNYSVCEFSCGGSGRYYFGVYYSVTDVPVFLSDFSVELIKSDGGFIYKSSDVTYYTEKIADKLYYYEATY